MLHSDGNNGGDIDDHQCSVTLMAINIGCSPTEVRSSVKQQQTIQKK